MRQRHLAPLRGHEVLEGASECQQAPKTPLLPGSPQARDSQPCPGVWMTLLASAGACKPCQATPVGKKRSILGCVSTAVRKYTDRPRYSYTWADSGDALDLTLHLEALIHPVKCAWSWIYDANEHYSTSEGKRDLCVLHTRCSGI